jgi:hypothetical protein
VAHALLEFSHAMHRLPCDYYGVSMTLLEQGMQSRIARICAVASSDSPRLCHFFSQGMGFYEVDLGGSQLAPHPACERFLTINSSVPTLRVAREPKRKGKGQQRPCWVGRVRSLRQLPRFRLSIIARDTEVSPEKQASCQSTCTRPLVSQPLKLAY